MVPRGTCHVPVYRTEVNFLFSFIKAHKVLVLCPSQHSASGRPRMMQRVAHDLRINRLIFIASPARIGVFTTAFSRRHGSKVRAGPRYEVSGAGFSCSERKRHRLLLHISLIAFKCTPYRWSPYESRLRVRPYRHREKRNNSAMVIQLAPKLCAGLRRVKQPGPYQWTADATQMHTTGEFTQPGFEPRARQAGRMLRAAPGRRSTARWPHPAATGR